MAPPQSEYIEEEVLFADEEAFESLFSQEGTFEDPDQEEDHEEDRSVTKWKDVIPTAENVRVTIGETQQSSWKQARVEIEQVGSMLIDNCNSYKPPLKQIIALIYGEHGKIYSLFKSELGWDFVFLGKFLATVAFQNAMNLSTTALYGKNSDRVSKVGFLSEKSYTDAWRSIGEQNLPKQGESANSIAVGTTYFWKTIETAFNETY